VVRAFVLVALVVAAAGAGIAREQSRTAIVERVVDGDTIELRSGTRVRLIGINAPEIAHNGYGDECFGEGATRFAERLLEAGQSVRLVFDVARRDHYDRLLAYVYRDHDGLFVNAEIVRRGYAYVETVPPNVQHADRFRRLARAARTNERGLWSECPTKGGRPTNPDRSCLSDYEGACVPAPPPDLDCVDIEGPVTIVGDDPHTLDGNYDGVACEPPPSG
jgi:micrococcal nuclease